MKIKDQMSPSLKGMSKAWGFVQKSIKKVRNAIVNLQKPFKSVFAALTGIGALAGAFFLVGKALRHTVNKMLEAERATAKVEGVLKATNFAIGQTTTSLKKMADEMVRVTTFTHDQVTEAQAILLTFTQISSEMFEKALMFGGDMSALFGQQLKQSMIQLGTALNDPIRGVGRLRRIGISFNETQRLTIKLLEAQGKRLEAQTVIMDELEREIGGAAEAMSKTIGGAIEQTLGMWNAMFARFGQLLGMLPQFREFIFGIRDSMRDMLEGNTAVTEQFIRKVFGNMKDILREVVPPIGFVIDMVVTLINASIKLNATFAMIGHFAEGIANLLLMIASAPLALGEMIVKAIAIVVLKMGGAFLQLGDLIIRLGENIGGTIWNFFNGITQKILEKVRELLEAIQETIDPFAGLFGPTAGFNTMLKTSIGLIKKLEGGIISYGDALIDVPTLTEQLELNELFGSETQAQIDELLNSWGGEGLSTFFGNMTKDALDHFTTHPMDVFAEKVNEMGTALGMEMDEDGNVIVNWDKAYMDMLNNINSTEAQLLAGLNESVIADGKLKEAIDEMNASVSKTSHFFFQASNILAAAGFENMEELGTSIGKGVVDGGLRDLFADLSGKVGGNIFGTTIQKAITDAFIAAERLRIQKELAGSPLMDEALQNVELEAGKQISPFAGLMGGLTGGLMSSLIGSLFNKEPKVPKKPVPVKVMNWGDMTQELLKVSTRRAVGPQIVSPGNSGMSNTFNRDMRF